MDKNQVTGIVLISLMLMAYLVWFQPEPPKPDPKKPTTTPTKVEALPEQAKLAALPDSVAQLKMGKLAAGAKGQAQDVVLENADIKVTFSSQGGKVKSVLLKNYVTFEKKPLVLIDEQSSQTSLTVQTANGPVDLHSLYYRVAQPNDSTVAFRLELDSANFVEQRYTLPKSGFVLGYRANLAALGGDLKAQQATFAWTDRVKKQEKDMNMLRATATVNVFQNNDELEYISETSQDPEELKVELPAKWVALKQKFFNTAIVTNGTFANVRIATVPQGEGSPVVKQLGMTLDIPVADLSDDRQGLRFYYGPNDFRIAELVAPGFEKNVYLGWAVFNVVNRYLIIPIFEFLEKLSSNYGVIIFLLVLVVKTFLFPLVYRSYMSMAKTRVLKPEIDDIKAKHGDDMQAVQQEQMKLYQQFGVNPLLGCIPVLLQLPVLLAMFNFFPNAIALRQKEFLWADDLSSYDSVLNLPFPIYFYGDHVSLFTILMTLSTIAYTYYNNQLQAATVDKTMQTVSYLMPVIFMFVLNSFSSGLTYYYFVSNIITIAQQLGIRRFVDEGKIRAQLEENHRKNSDPNKKKSSFQQKLEQALRAQEEAKSAKSTEKNKKK